MDTIEINGARTHNLKNIHLSLPRDKLIVVTGLSGSGKSSLAFDTLYAEGQRRYVESLSAYARQFLSMMEKPDVDHIEGLSPAISIEQKSTSHNPRSTVGTITEIADYLRLLFARTGTPKCPQHGITLEAQTISQMVDTLNMLPDNEKIMLLAPVVQNRKGEHLQLLEDLKRKGFIRARINGIVTELDQPIKLDLHKKHTIEVVVDRLKTNQEQRLRLTESFETTLELTGGIAIIHFMEGHQNDLVFSANFSCPQCGYSIAELEPRLFSFNNPSGACQKCDGLGHTQFFDPESIVSEPDFSLSQGAIRGWDRRNSYYFQMIESLAHHYDFDIDKPFKKLPQKIKDTLLYGSGDEDISFQFHNDRGDLVTRTYPFEGVIPNMERRFRETESRYVREELSKHISKQICPDCQGSRLTTSARNVFINRKNLPDINRMSVEDAYRFFDTLKLKGKRGEIADKILKEVRARLSFLMNVGLNYLTLERSAETLSGGEAQRIRLASQIGSGLVGVMYILDEPSIGLHQRDNQRLLSTLFHLRDLGNTVLVVEHDEEAILSADYVVDIGPGAGVHGGQVVAEGTPDAIMQSDASVTGQYLAKKRRIEIPKIRKQKNPNHLIKINNARGNNLKNVDIEIPLGLLTCVTGVSGSGKSTLINGTLYPVVAEELNGTRSLTPAPLDSIEGLEQLDKVVDIDQSPIGRTPRSNPATYTGIFTPVREIFAATQEARSRGYKPGRFSFNVKGGRCEACEGDGLVKVEMHFLPDIYVPCDICKGKRYNRETLDIKYKGKNIHEVLDLTVEDALEFFSAIPVVARKLQTLMDVGLSYIKLGQSATTLSGGEAQRIKLAKELSKRDTGNTLYILDEPTTGLHFHDVSLLLEVLHRLRDHGNTIVVIEHNLDVIKTADWIIDLGPEGGHQGGQIIGEGSPEEIIKNKHSYTGQYLKSLL